VKKGPGDPTAVEQLSPHVLITPPKGV